MSKFELTGVRFTFQGAQYVLQHSTKNNRGKNMKFQSFIIQLNAQTGIAV